MSRPTQIPFAFISTSFLFSGQRKSRVGGRFTFKYLGLSKVFVFSPVLITFIPIWRFFELPYTTLMNITLRDIFMEVLFAIV